MGFGGFVGMTAEGDWLPLEFAVMLEGATDAAVEEVMFE